MLGEGMAAEKRLHPSQVWNMSLSCRLLLFIIFVSEISFIVLYILFLCFFFCCCSVPGVYHICFSFIVLYILFLCCFFLLLFCPRFTIQYNSLFLGRLGHRLTRLSPPHVCARAVADPAILKRGRSQPRVKGGFQLYAPIQMHWLAKKRVFPNPGTPPPPWIRHC